MAFPLPAPIDPAVGDWATLKFEIPDFIKDIAAAINSVAEILITFLDIGLTVLRFVKSFLIAFLDPIKAIVEAILAQIRALIDALRKIGAYLTSDYPLLTPPYPDLIGGYADFERRMIGKLTDRTDPTRPDTSGQIKTLAAFFYVSADFTEIQRLIETIKKILKFFNQTFTLGGGPPTPAITGVKYGFAGGTGFTGAYTAAYDSLVAVFRDGTPPDVAEVAWQLTPNTVVSEYLPTPPFPPGGFLVTVSTLPEGIRLVYDRPDKNRGDASSHAAPSKKMQPRDYGPVLELDSGRPAILHGGADMILWDWAFTYNKPLKGDTLAPGFTRIYGLSPDNEVIPLDLIKQGDVYLFQRTFWVESFARVLDWMSGGYTYALEYDQMPHIADVQTNSDGTVALVDRGPASTFYVRIASCTEDVIKNRSFKYDLFSYAPMRDAGMPVQVPLRGAENTSAFSQPFKVTFPSVDTAEYLKAVETALAVLVLSRADMPVLDELTEVPDSQKKLAEEGQLMIPGVALQRTGLEGLKSLIRLLYIETDIVTESKRRGENPRDFRVSLRNRIHRLVLDLYERTGPMPDIEARVVEQTGALRNVTWKQLLKEAGETGIANWWAGTDMTILESIDVHAEESDAHAEADDYGVALNPYCIGVTEPTTNELFFVDGLIRGRSPHFIVTQLGGDVPVVRSTSSAAETVKLLSSGDYFMQQFYAQFVRNDGKLEVPDDFYDGVTQVIQRGRKDGSGDMAPVFYSDKSQMQSMSGTSTLPGSNVGMVFCRDIFSKAEGNRIFGQAALALGIAASAAKNLGPGQWVSVRFLASFPGLEGIFDTLLRWLEGIAEALKGVIDQIIKYIEFLESRLVELQQLIRRINALIQSILGFVFQIPSCSALLLLSNGTDGVLSDFVTAGNKPYDSPLAYGAGVAAVMPLIPGAPIDFLLNFFVRSDDPVVPGATMGEQPVGETLMGVENLPAPTAPTTDEPDVL